MLVLPSDGATMVMGINKNHDIINSLYHGDLKWLAERTILFGRSGSHAYGLNTPESDEDFKGIAVAPKAHYLGNLNRFEQAQSKSDKGNGVEVTIFELKKFIKLATEANPNILESLFLAPEDLLVVNEMGEKLIDNRKLFLSKKAKHTYSGYSFSQLKRIKLHRHWLMHPVLEPPDRKSMGLPERTLIPTDQLKAAEAAITKKLEEWQLDCLEVVEPATRIFIQSRVSELLAEMKIATDDLWVGAARTLGFSDNFIYLLDLERRYKARKTEFDNYQHWKLTRNPKRAAIEAKYGYDCNHALILVRLQIQAEEIATTGTLNVKRHDREWLLSIRNGAWSYDQLIEWSEKQEAKVNKLYITTNMIPNEPPRIAIDKLCVEIVESMI